MKKISEIMAECDPLWQAEVVLWLEFRDDAWQGLVDDILPYGIVFINERNDKQKLFIPWRSIQYMSLIDRSSD